MNIMQTRQPRILEDVPKPVVVEKKRKRTIQLPGVKVAAASVAAIDHATVVALASAVSATTVEANKVSEHQRVRSLVADGKYEEAARIAARLINSGSAAGFFIHSGSDEYTLVDTWFRGMVTAGKAGKISEFCELTPELSQIILLRNDGNRRVNAANLAAIMRDMACRRWAANGETIIVAADGSLNDGQHRSFAALITGSCVETAIAFGVDRASMATVDIGRKRTGADRLGIGGVQNYVPMSAISNLILEMKNGRAPTPAETDEFYFANKDLIEAAHSAAGSNMKGIGPSAAGAACAYLLSVGHKRENVANFFASVKSGEMMPKRDPRMVLHKAIFDARFKIKLSRDNWVKAFVAHFLAHMSGKTMQSVNWDVSLSWGL